MIALAEEKMAVRLEKTEELREKISGSVLPLSGSVLPLYRGGRKVGDTNLPPELRTVIALMANGPHGSVKETAKTFQISEAHAQNLKQGKVNGKTKDAQLVHDVEKLKGTVYERALDKTLAVLDRIGGEEDEDEMKTLGVIQKARLARDLSAVAKNMTPEHREVNIGQVVVLNPAEKKEEDYQVVVVNRSSR